MLADNWLRDNIVSEIRDKGKGPYMEISTLLSEYLVIQVQDL